MISFPRFTLLLVICGLSNPFLNGSSHPILLINGGFLSYIFQLKNEAVAPLTKGIEDHIPEWRNSLETTERKLQHEAELSNEELLDCYNLLDVIKKELKARNQELTALINSINSLDNEYPSTHELTVQLLAPLLRAKNNIEDLLTYTRYVWNLE